MSKKTVNVGSDQRVHVTKDSVALNPPAPGSAAPPVVTQAPPPAVTWITPAAASTVSTATVGLLVAVTSQVTVTGVDYLDASNSNALIGHATHGTFGWLVTWNSTGVADGARSISAVATDSLGQTTTVTLAVTVRNTAPAPPTVTFVTPPDGGTVQGTTVGLLVSVTSTLTVTSVAFSINSASLGNATHGAFGWLKVWDSTAVTDGDHEIEVTATDSNAQTTTVTRTVNVDNIPPAPGPPTITVGTPVNNATVTGTTVGLVAAAAAFAPATISKVEFFVDNVSIGTGTSGSAGYTRTWDSTGTANGSHTIKGTVTDSTGQTTSDSVTVTVNNASQLAITLVAPASGTTVTGRSVILFATATDNSPNTVTGVNFYRNNNLLGAGTQSGGGWIYKWDTTSVADASYTIRATATDSTAATASATTTVQVKNTVPAPTVTFVTPAPSATIAGSIGVLAVPVSTLAIAGVQFFVDGVLLASASQTGFGWVSTWDTTAATDGSHLLKVVATDARSQTGTFTIAVNVHNAVAVPGKVLVTNSSTNPAVAIDLTDTRESTMGIRNWISANTVAGDIVRIPAGTYFVDGPINVGGTRTFEAYDPAHPPVFHRHTVYPYRIKPDLRAGQSTYNPNGRSSQWQYDALGGQASIPTSQGNPFQTGTAAGSDFGGYDAKVTRSGTQVIGLTALYGAPWTQADVGSIVQYLVESGFNGSYQSTVQSVASDGKSLVFDTPVAVSSGTSPGSEGTVAWCRHVRGAGWKVEHQTNDLLSFYVGPSVNHDWSGYQNALAAVVNAQYQPIVQFTDTTSCVLDGIVLQHANDDWHGAILNYEKSDPLVTEFMRCVETKSPNQIIRNCELHHVWGAGEHGPAQLIDTDIHHCGMQACTGHWDNKLIDGGVWQNTHHSVIDIEQPGGGPHTNVTIQNLTWGGPKGLVSVSTPVNGLTIKNVSSTTALKNAGTIDTVAGMWSSDGGRGFTVACSNVLLDHFNTDSAPNGSAHAVEATNVTGLTVTNSRTPGITGAFVKYGTSTNVTATGNDGGSGAGSTTQKAT